MAEPQNIVYDWVSADDMEQAIKIEEQGEGFLLVLSPRIELRKEREGYPADEAASLEAFRYRQSNAPTLFLGAYLPQRKLIGYICSTLSPDSSLTHASMSTHVPGASSVCIHSVCVDSVQRRRGVGLGLLNEYIKRLSSYKEKEGKYERVLLITHEPLRHFYEKAGFEWMGLSSVTHGALPWYEMHIVLNSPPQSKLVNSAEEALALPDSDNPEAARAPPAELYEALARTSRRPRPTAKLLGQYEGGVEELKVEHPGKKGVWVNRVDLLCPRPGCGSFVLRAGKAEWQSRASFDMDPPHLSTAPSSHLPKLPTPPETTDWWLVAPTPMEFENIGFSRAVEGLVAGELAFFSPLRPLFIFTSIRHSLLRTLMFRDTDINI
ncbi:hypothetical protein C0991_002370 [Blastosporella zonata]|nr:hypothetical protein C0991_002370 [Blastosporella zonata]